MESGVSVTFRLQLLEICNKIVQLKEERRQKRSEYNEKFDNILTRHEQIVSRRYSRLGIRRHIACKYDHRKNVLPAIEEDRKKEPTEILEETVSHDKNIKTESSSLYNANSTMSSNVEKHPNKETIENTVVQNVTEDMMKQDAEYVKTSRLSGKSRVTFASDKPNTPISIAERFDGLPDIVKRGESAKQIQDVIHEEVDRENTRHTMEKKKSPEALMKQMSSEEINKYLDEVAMKVFKDSLQYNRYSYISRERASQNREPIATNPGYGHKSNPKPKPVVRQTLPRLAVARRQLSSSFEGESTSLYSRRRTAYLRYNILRR